METAQLTKTSVSIQNVLIATDFSCYSAAALRCGFELAHRYHAHAQIAYVIATDEYLLAGPEAVMAARDSARRDLLELKDQMERSFSCVEGQDYDISLLEGPVADCMLECAHNKHANLIVVGTHGRSGIGKVLMGSVAERIFRHSSVPVMTIGPHMHQGALVAKNILLAADFTTASEHASAYASSLAREDGAVLTIVHAVNRLSSEAAADRERVRCAMEEKLAQLLGENKEGLDVRLRIEFGEVVPAILRAATESQADYVVLGVSRELSVFDRFKWPTAYAVVREAHCPVLTVRG